MTKHNAEEITSAMNKFASQQDTLKDKVNKLSDTAKELDRECRSNAQSLSDASHRIDAIKEPGDWALASARSQIRELKERVKAVEYNCGSISKRVSSNTTGITNIRESVRASSKQLKDGLAIIKESNPRPSDHASATKLPTRNDAVASGNRQQQRTSNLKAALHHPWQSSDAASTAADAGKDRPDSSNTNATPATWFQPQDLREPRVDTRGIAPQHHNPRYDTFTQISPTGASAGTDKTGSP